LLLLLLLKVVVCGKLQAHGLGGLRNGKHFF
jgi:hypothetical protein